MKKNLFNLARKGAALTLAAIMTLSTASAAFAVEVDSVINPAVEAETEESGAADESLDVAIDAEIAAMDEQESEPEATVVEEAVTAPVAEEGDDAVIAEEETAGEGFEAGEYSEMLDSGTEESEEIAETENTENVESTNAAAEETEAAEEVASEESEETEEIVEAEDVPEDDEVIEDLEDPAQEPPVFVGSIDAGLTSQLTSVGSVTVNPGTYSPYFNSQSTNGVGAGTQQYSVTQGGKTYTAYCAEPEYVGVNSPSSRTAYEILDSSFGGWGANIKKVMFYTHGAPGGKGGNAAYDKLMAWVNADLGKQTNPPTTQSNLAYAYSHVIVAKAFNDMKNNTGYGGPNSLWAIGATGSFASALATVQDIVNTAYAQANVPAGFRVYLVPSTAEKSQSFMYWSYNPTGYLKIHKEIVAQASYREHAPEGFPENYFVGKNYTPQGAEYTVYKDSSCTQPAATLTIGAGNSRTDQINTDKVYGESTTVELPAGTYYVKETKAPTQGWADMDAKVYTVNVTENNTVNQPVIVTSKDGAKRAWLQIKKVSADPNVTASTAGAKFGIYKYNTDGQLSGYLGYVTTDANGSTGHFLLPCGHYYVKELEPPSNGVYKLNDGIYDVTLEPGGYINDDLTIEDEPKTGGLQVIKEPEESVKEIVTGNSCYSLEGAVFEVYKDRSCTQLVDGGTLTTDTDGETPVLDGLAIGDYYIIEKQASKGFGKPLNTFTKSNPYKVTITADDIKNAVVKKAVCQEPPKNDPISIVIQKVDAEGGEVASLEGAKFAIKYYNGEYTEETLPAQPMWTWVVKTIDVGGKYRAGLDSASLVAEESDPLYVVGGIAVFPYGTVSVEELEAPEGYVCEKGKILGVFVINEEYSLDDGFVMVDGVATLETKINEQRARYGVSFTKVDDAGTKLANVPFMVKNKATGEQHIMLTDANGVLSTEANKHSANTNANDKAYVGGVIDESKLDPTAGVWFSGAKTTDLTYLDDARGALPYGDYTFTELRSSANEGMSLVAPFTVKIDGTKEDGEVINLGNKVDKNKNIITAVTSERTGTQITLAEKNAAFTDAVTLSGYAGACTITTKIYDIAANQQLAFGNGSTEIVTNVTANGKETTIDVPFVFDASALAGKAVAVVTTVENGGETVTHNADFADEAEKIYFPQVSTRATVDGKKVSEAGGTKTIVDRVTYAGFPEGTSVKAVAEAVKKGATADEDVVLHTASKTATFNSNGTINTQLSINTDELGGAAVYINEKIYVTVSGRDILVAQENGRTDNNQNVSFVEISTKVVNAETGSGLAFAKKDAAFTDALTIAGFDGDVTAVTKLYNVTDGAYAVFSDGASEITTTITADGSGQTVEIPFEVDGTAYAGKVLTIETSVTGNDQTFTHNAAHDDADETIYFPAITTVAKAENGHYASFNVPEITDTVTWAAMPVGIELTTKSRVFIKGETVADDEEITEAVKSSSYTAEASDGSRDVVIVLDTAKYAGSVLYITEEDYVTVDGKEVLIAAETDREAIDQYIYIPKLITTAVSADTGEKTIPSVGNVSIKDTVEFSGFRTGETLKTVTEAWAKGETAEDDILITSVEGTYTTETAKGIYDVVLKFALTDDITGKPVYVVEKDYIDGELVATEGDRENAKQTVTPVTIGTTLTDTRTETHIAYAGEKVILQDEIEYDGLVIGKEYKLYTLLQNEDGFAYNTKGEATAVVAAHALQPDKDLGPEDPPMESEAREAKIKEVIDANDLIYAETIRKAPTVNGSFFVDVEFDGVPFKGEKVVAAEGLYEKEGDGKLLAIHSDPKDRNQTVEFPKILTTATDKTGTKMVGAFDGQTVIDTVAYEKMGEGTAIITVTELVKKGETAEEDEVLKVVRSAQTVSGDGSYEVEIPLDAKDLAGSTLYVTERNYIVRNDGTEEPIADHVDRDDESQTVYVPKLITSAADAKDGTKLISALDGEDAEVKDTVNYYTMVPGTPVITVARLYVKGETAEEDQLVAEVKAEAARLIETADGSYDVVIPFDSAAYEGKTLYVTEENYLVVTKTDEEGKETEEEVKISEHVDRDDEAQTVKVPVIGTTLTDDETQTHISHADADVDNTDVIAFENLEKGATYEALCIYMDDKGNIYRKDGSIIDTDALTFMEEYEEQGNTDKLDAAGILYKTTEFTADAEDGSASVTIHYDGTPFLGKKMVAAEGIYENGALLAVHIEPGDEDQTVYLPKVITTAANTKTGGKRLLAEDGASVTDTVDYEKMPEGTDVATVTELVRKGETEADDAVIKTVRSKQTLTGEGSYDVEITFDASELGDSTLYVTERVYIVKEDGNEEIISEHVDRDDEAQTVYVPKIGTTLTDDETKMHISHADADVSNTDVIAFENLEKGATYEALCIFMDDKGRVYRKDGSIYETDALTLMKEFEAQGNTDKLDATGILYKTTEFTADAEDGRASVTIRYDGTYFLGKKMVAAEGVYENGALVAVHIEPGDEDQTVYLPKIITSAVDGKTGGKTLTASLTTTIVDHLRYESYPEGTEITTVLEVYDTATDKPVLENGKPMTVEKTFKTDASGKTEVTVVFNGTGLVGKKLGLTEKNYLTVNGERILVSEDSYKTNNNQIVEIVEDGKISLTGGRQKQSVSRTRTFVKTGDTSNTILWIVVMLASVAVIYVMARKKFRKN